MRFLSSFDFIFMLPGFFLSSQLQYQVRVAFFLSALMSALRRSKVSFNFG